MTKIRLVKGLAGDGFYLPPGTLTEVEPQEASRLIEAGIAEAVGYETATAKNKTEIRGVQDNNGGNKRTNHQGRSQKLA